MPELPEVETCRRALEPLLVGRRIGQYSASDKALRLRESAESMAKLAGSTVLAVRRRSKYLLIDCDEQQVIVHLGMTGQLFMSEHSPPWLKHEHWRLQLDQGCLRYRDPRRFGMLLRVGRDDLAGHRLLKHLGPEPLEDWQANDFIRLCKSSNKPIKHLIMDAKTVCGVGNIYAAEALFMARVHPLRRARLISAKRLTLLHHTIIEVLSRAVESGGSTVKDFVSSDGAPGYFAQQLQVYGRGGQACVNCETALKSLVSAGRRTVFCGSCQR
jgi:formamidopyrimidine-DNA glycosylase